MCYQKYRQKTPQSSTSPERKISVCALDLYSSRPSVYLGEILFKQNNVILCILFYNLIFF